MRRLGLTTSRSSIINRYFLQHAWYFINQIKRNDINYLSSLLNSLITHEPTAAFHPRCGLMGLTGSGKSRAEFDIRTKKLSFGPLAPSLVPDKKLRGNPAS